MDSLTPSFSTQWAAKKSRMVQTKKKPQSSSRTWKKKQNKTGAPSHSISIMSHMTDRKIF